ncbi:hypothetical protein [Xylanibacter oryzae]|nr:hypothetical protein [Xylanibacter oryzae]
MLQSDSLVPSDENACKTRHRVKRLLRSCLQPNELIVSVLAIG